MGLVCASSILTLGCNTGVVSQVKVAGGVIDGADGKASLYPGTVYVEVSGIDFDKKPALVRNVGTLVDVGLGDAYALILSLADVFQAENGVAVLPIMKEVTITLFLSSGAAKDKVELPKMIMRKDDGLMQDANGLKYFILNVGVKAEKVGSIDSKSEQAISKLTQRLFFESPLMSEKGQNFRDSNSSFMMISIPKSVLPSIAVPSIMFAEDRPSEASLKGVVVGFGENAVGGSKKNDFSLSEALPEVMKRNFAPIEALNKTPTEYTPLRKLIGSATAVSQQMWEFTGSGLCGSKDGKNYDTGAAVYIDGKFAEFGVLSTAISAGYKGRLDCAMTTADDMVTLVISPSKEQVETFISRSK